MKGLVPGSISKNSGNIGKRDAFHIPAILCVSKENIRPGDMVKFVSNSEVVRASKEDYQGFADFFITGLIQPLSEFYVFLKPDTVTDVRHTFTVEGLPEEDSQNQTTQEIKQMLLSIIQENNNLKNENKKLQETNETLEEELDSDGCRGCW